MFFLKLFLHLAAINFLLIELDLIRAKKLINLRIGNTRKAVLSKIHKFNGKFLKSTSKIAKIC